MSRGTPGRPKRKVTDEMKYRIWGALSVATGFAIIVSSIAAAFLLDTLIIRSATAGSVTTMLPGAVYGSVLVMKTCIGQALILILIAIGVHVHSRFKPRFPS